MPLPFATIRDLDRQRQQHFDQTVAKQQSSPLDGEQRKRARTPPQADPNDAPITEHAQQGGRKDCERGHSKTRSEEHRQWELDRACSKSRAHSKSRVCSKSLRWSKSRKRSKSRRCSKSRVCSKHEVRKPGVWLSQPGRSPSKGRHQEDRFRQLPSTSSHSYEQTRAGGRTEHLAPSNNELSKFIKLKEEVVKWPQSYIRGRATLIARTLAPDHEAVKCLVAFGENALKYAAEVLAIIEWGTQHWKLQEPFPVPQVPRWLRMPEMIQTTTPLRGELSLIPSGTHLEDIRIRSPALWAWMAILLQYWQDHMTRHLFRGRFRQASDLASTLIHDINPWLPHRAQFGWSYMATHATLWLDMRDQFGEEHLTEWEAQKSLTRSLNDLECDTEVIY